MSREAILITLGLVLAASCFFSGLPFSFLRWVFAGFGLAIAVIGYSLRARSAQRAARESHAALEAVA